jgi:hypothetical protein
MSCAFRSLAALRMACTICWPALLDGIATALSADWLSQMMVTFWRCGTVLRWFPSFLFVTNSMA